MAQSFCRKFSRLLVAICTIAVLGGCAGGVNTVYLFYKKVVISHLKGFQL